MNASIAVASGSSPLTRGKLWATCLSCEKHRLIPAHAGKTTPRNCPAWRARAHPRSRGENHRLTSGLEDAGGSSPLTRGKLLRVASWCCSGGLIPAHAGKTNPGLHAGRLHRAHPRSRGENERARDDAGIPWGSSPLTRGKLTCRSVLGQPGGLIPAHAGKTLQGCGGPWAARAHPRSRGENDGAALPEWVLEGSSPLTRGKLDNAGAALGRDGLIPAHAGKTLPASSHSASSRAHPRSRGENSFL